MIYHVRALQSIGKAEQSFMAVVNAGVPLDQDPPEINFSFLDAPKDKTIQLDEDQGHLAKFGNEPNLVRAMGLISCAAVCFVNREDPQDLRGYVYHGPSGVISKAKFTKIMEEIGANGPRYRHVSVIYAHPERTSRGYKENLGNLDEWLNGGRVVEVTHVFGPNFAMNQSDMVGY